MENKIITFEEFADVKKHPFSNLGSKMARAYRKTFEELKSASGDDALAEIQRDIENFMNIVGGYSRYDLAQKLHRCELDIAKAKRNARNILKKAIQDNPVLSPDNVENRDVVQAAFAERDRIIAELKPIVAELEKKRQDAGEILKKYA